MSIANVFAALILSAVAFAAPAPASQEGGAPPPQAVVVDAYHGNYEGAKTDSEQRYDSGILSALGAREGSMEGSWKVLAADGSGLLSLELRNDASTSRIEGAWRSLMASYGINGSGFVASADLTGRELELNYFVGTARSPIILRLHKDGDNLWRGEMMDIKGQKTPVLMSRQ